MPGLYAALALPLLNCHSSHILTQDPVIFSGTVRSNLDPFGTAGSDSVLWTALRQSGLGPAVEAMPVRFPL